MKKSRAITSVPARLGSPPAVFCLAGIFAAAIGWQSSAQSAESVEQARAQTDAQTLRAENGTPLFVAGTVAANAEEPKIEQCLDPEICPIPYVRLAKQETEPFLFYGKVVDVNHPRYEDYPNALRRFPDVRSCLTTDEREKPQPDLRQIDWGAIGNIREIEVCVFRIASSIEDIETIILWLRHHGFEVREMQRRMSDTYVPRYETESIFNLESFLAIEKFRKIIPRVWFTRIIGLELGTSYALSMSFSQKYQLVGVYSRVRTMAYE